MSFINKILTQAHRKRSHLQNRFLKNRCSVNRVINKQRNYCISFSRKSKKEYHANLNKKDVADNKKFWKNKSSIFFLTKLNPRKSCIRRNDKIRTQDIKIADELNSFFFSSLVICSANQWTGFYIISASVMKGLKISCHYTNLQKIFSNDFPIMKWILGNVIWS